MASHVRFLIDMDLGAVICTLLFMFYKIVELCNLDLTLHFLEGV